MAITKKAISIAMHKNTVASLIRNQRRNILAATRKVPASVLAGDATRAGRWCDTAERAYRLFGDGPEPVSVEAFTLVGLRARLEEERGMLDVLLDEQPFSLESCNG